MKHALTIFLKWLFLALFILAMAAGFLAVRELGQDRSGHDLLKRTLAS